jgi:tripartite-type tricarboxylate transporter receptor subunit TctC
MLKPCIAASILLAPTLLLPITANAQDYPNKPIRMVTAAVGGGADFVARLIAQGLSEGLGQQVIVENRTAGIVQAEIVAKAPPDGYTLLAATGAFWTFPLMEKVPYDPVRDFSPVSLTVSAPSVLVVHPSVAANSVKELIAVAKAKPGSLNYASGPSGSSNHLSSELFKSMAGVDIVRIAYKGSGPGVLAVIGGEAQMIITSPNTVAPHVKAGKLRALAVTSAQPSALVPNLPTIAASGLPGYEFISIDAIFAPARTPAPVIKRLNQEIVRTLNRADIKEKFFNSGTEIVGSSPEQAAVRIKAEMTRLAKLIKEAGIKSE